MAESLTLVCILSPRPGKLERLKNLLTALAQNVHANEKGCGKYIVFEQKDAGNEEADMVLIEKWRSQAALDNHHQQDYLKETHQAIEKEDLLTKPEVIKVVEQLYIFERLEN